MSSTRKNQTEIVVPEDLPIIEIKREFDAPVDRLFRAWAERDLFAECIGPRSIETTVEDWDCSTGGRYRYSAGREGEEIVRFYGSFHEVRENERIVQTFTYEGFPDGVALEIMTFEFLPDGRSRVHSVSVGESVEGRDEMVASGMETGIVEGNEKLDEVLVR
ncbi:SRPBCC family protein [soil metagenome]